MQAPLFGAFDALTIFDGINPGGINDSLGPATQLIDHFQQVDHRKISTVVLQ